MTLGQQKSLKMAKEEQTEAKQEESPVKEENTPKKETKKLSSEKKLIQDLLAKNKELLETAQRLQAEFENYKKRSEKDVLASNLRAKASILKQLLPTLDAFDSALQTSQDKGLQAIYKVFNDVLSAQGVRPVETTGEQFNYDRHEVVMTQPSEEKENTILQEVQKGYMFNDSVLRYAKVIVAKNAEGEQ